MRVIAPRAKRPGLWASLIGFASLLALVGSPINAHAAQIYGKVNKGGVLIRVQCKSGDSAETRADGQGSYQVFIAKTGPCTLILPEQGGAQATVYSYGQPARFDFDVIPGNPPQLKGH